MAWLPSADLPGPHEIVCAQPHTASFIRAFTSSPTKHKVEIDPDPRHVTHKEFDRSAALQRERVVDERERRHARQQSCALQIDLVHGFNTRSPSAERDTQGRSLPLGNCD